MIRIELYAPHLEERACRMLERGCGVTWDMELVERIVQIAWQEELDIEFMRLERGGEVVWDLEIMETALEMNMEMRPLDSWGVSGGD